MKIEIRADDKLYLAGGSQQVLLCNNVISLNDSNFEGPVVQPIGFYYQNKTELHLTSTRTDGCQPLYQRYGDSLWSWCYYQNKGYQIIVDEPILFVDDISYLFSKFIITKNSNLQLINVSNVFNFQGTFFDCYFSDGLIDLTGWNTQNAISMQKMFGKCFNLQHIYVSNGWSVNNVVTSKDMFEDDYMLHKFNNLSIDASMAQIDLGAGKKYLQQHWVDLHDLYYRIADDNSSVAIIGEPHPAFNKMTTNKDYIGIHDIYILGPITIPSLNVILNKDIINIHDIKRIKITN